MSVDRELIERLLKRVEDETIDFKETEYDFGTKKIKIESENELSS